VTAAELFLFILGTFRLTRLIMYDSITAFLRKPFHEIMEETLPDGAVQSFLHIKGSRLRHWIGGTAELLLVHRNLMCCNSLYRQHVLSYYISSASYDIGDCWGRLFHRMGSGQMGFIRTSGEKKVFRSFFYILYEQNKKLLQHHWNVYGNCRDFLQLFFGKCQLYLKHQNVMKK
jgi:hypothetical protein